MKASQYYLPLWRKYLPKILHALEGAGGKKQSVKLDGSEFECLGDRGSYTFTLEFCETDIPIKSGKAQARDFRTALLENLQFRSFAKGKVFAFHMDRNFELSMVYVEMKSFLECNTSGK